MKKSRLTIARDARQLADAFEIVVEIRSADIEAIVAAFEQESIIGIAIIARTMRW